MSIPSNDAYYGTSLFPSSSVQTQERKVAQFKEVDPSFETQTIFPSPEYRYLYAVQVNPVYYTRTPNEYGGDTIRILGG